MVVQFDVDVYVTAREGLHTSVFHCQMIVQQMTDYSAIEKGARVCVLVVRDYDEFVTIMTYAWLVRRWRTVHELVLLREFTFMILYLCIFLLCFACFVTVSDFCWQQKIAQTRHFIHNKIMKSCYEILQTFFGNATGIVFVKLISLSFLAKSCLVFTLFFLYYFSYPVEVSISGASFDIIRLVAFIHYCCCLCCKIFFGFYKWLHKFRVRIHCKLYWSTCVDHLIYTNNKKRWTKIEKKIKKEWLKIVKLSVDWMLMPYCCCAAHENEQFVLQTVWRRLRYLKSCRKLIHHKSQSWNMKCETVQNFVATLKINN